MAYFRTSAGGYEPYIVAAQNSVNAASGGFYNRYYFDLSKVKKIELIGYSGTGDSDTKKDITITVRVSANNVSDTLKSVLTKYSLQHIHTGWTAAGTFSTKTVAGNSVKLDNPISVEIPTDDKTYKSACIEIIIPDYNWYSTAVYKVYPR